jgi:hypothetical protein
MNWFSPAIRLIKRDLTAHSAGPHDLIRVAFFLVCES